MSKSRLVRSWRHNMCKTQLRRGERVLHARGAQCALKLAHNIGFAPFHAVRVDARARPAPLANKPETERSRIEQSCIEECDAAQELRPLAPNDFRLSAPTQFWTHGQWWSMRSTHLHGAHGWQSATVRAITERALAAEQGTAHACTLCDHAAVGHSGVIITSMTTVGTPFAQPAVMAARRLVALAFPVSGQE